MCQSISFVRYCSRPASYCALSKPQVEINNLTSFSFFSHNQFLGFCNILPYTVLFLLLKIWFCAVVLFLQYIAEVLWWKPHPFKIRSPQIHIHTLSQWRASSGSFFLCGGVTDECALHIHSTVCPLYVAQCIFPTTPKLSLFFITIIIK